MPVVLIHEPWRSGPVRGKYRSFQNKVREAHQVVLVGSLMCAQVLRMGCQKEYSDLTRRCSYRPAQSQRIRPAHRVAHATGQTSDWGKGQGPGARRPELREKRGEAERYKQHEHQLPAYLAGSWGPGAACSRPLASATLAATASHSVLC